MTSSTREIVELQQIVVQDPHQAAPQQETNGGAKSMYTYGDNDEYGLLVHLNIVLAICLFSTSSGAISGIPGGFDDTGDAKLSLRVAYDVFLQAHGTAILLAWVSIILHLVMLTSKKWRASSLLIEVIISITLWSSFASIIGHATSYFLLAPRQSTIKRAIETAIVVISGCVAVVLYIDAKAIIRLVLIILAPSGSFGIYLLP